MAYYESQWNVRLGSAELAILKELRRVDEPVPRQVLLLLVHTQVSSSTEAASQTGVAQLLPTGRARQNAESTLSRALRSLERKGLIVRTVCESTRRSLISTASPRATRRLKRSACEEEAFAARCDAASAELRELARKARTRARNSTYAAVPMAGYTPSIMLYGRSPVGGLGELPRRGRK